MIKVAFVTKILKKICVPNIDRKHKVNGRSEDVVYTIAVMYIHNLNKKNTEIYIHPLYKSSYYRI